jgi:ATP-dependent RNA helicase RhlE
LTPDISFDSLGLSEPLLRAVLDAGYTIPTPIQAQAIPLVAQGGDLLAAAQTGTGKTAGFTLPVLHRLMESHGTTRPGRPRCLILVPTRELAAQVAESVQTYGKHLPLTSLVMFGGVGINPQINALKKRVDILIATPGRLLDHVGQKTLDLSGIEILVLDEADRMLDMGFIRDIKKILALLPKARQNLLFSATFSDEIRELANGLLKNPGCIEVARRNTASELVEQSVYHIGQKHKRELLAHLIKERQWFQVLVFTRTKHGANKLAEYLAKHSIPTAAIHGNKSQAARTRALADFKNGKLPVLVATDIAARGLDIDQLPQVINFELPNVPEDYVHRIGRTGRAGSTGAAISLVDREEMKLLQAIERVIKRKVEVLPLGDFVPSQDAAGDPNDEPRAAREPRAPRGEARSEGRSGQGRPGRGEGPRPATAAKSGSRPNGKPAAPRGPKPEGATRQADGNRAPVPVGEDNEPNFNVEWMGPDGKPVRNSSEVDGNRPSRREPSHPHGRPGHGDRPGGAPRNHSHPGGPRGNGQPGGQRGNGRAPQRPALFSAKGNRSNG